MNSMLSHLVPRTLRGRLSLVALTTATLLMTVLTVAFNTVIRHRLQHQADDELHTRAAAVATTVDTSGPTVRVLETSNDQLLDTNVWIYSGTRLLEQPPSTTGQSTLAHAADSLARRGGTHCLTAEEPGSARLCGLPVSGGRSTATVVTALDLSPYRSSAATLLWASLCLDAVMLACTYLLTRLAVGRALRPVATMTDQATQWSAVASEERFGAVRRPTELARLGASLDAILDRIHAVLRHEQQLTGELSHELRTPLSRVIAELDWWRARPRSAAETAATHEVIADAARSMRSICDTPVRPSPAFSFSRSAAVSPTVVHSTLITQKYTVTSGTLFQRTRWPGAVGADAGSAAVSEVSDVMRPDRATRNLNTS